MRFTIGTLCRRFITEDCGQDLIEYGLLTGIVTVSSILVFEQLVTRMGNAYGYWQNQGQQNWIPSPPSP